MSGVDQDKQPFNPMLAVLAALAALFFVFPLIGLITGAPWGHVTDVITSKSSRDALGLSIIASLSSTVIALLFGFPLAWLLARGNFRGKGLLRGLTTLPMVLPPVVGGIALLLAYGRRGIIGEPLDKATGVPIPADQNDITEYPIVQVKDAPNSSAAKAFISYVLGPDGQQVLASFGFMPPG